eukprot:gene8588-biopygen3141
MGAPSRALSENAQRVRSASNTSTRGCLDFLKDRLSLTVHWKGWGSISSNLAEFCKWCMTQSIKSPKSHQMFAWIGSQKFSVWRGFVGKAGKCFKVGNAPYTNGRLWGAAPLLRQPGAVRHSCVPRSLGASGRFTICTAARARSRRANDTVGIGE